LKKREKKQDDKRSTRNNNNINNRKNRKMSLLGIDTLWKEFTNRRQVRQEGNFMQRQYENQRKLNEQGRDIQMDIWNKTNYGAQVEHMKNAGLNPALMYGSAGQGGTTGSQGGGSASKGNAPKAPVMDLQSALIDAQINSMNAKAESDRANADATSGYKEDESRTRAIGLEIANKINAMSREAQIEMFNSELKKMNESIEELSIKNNVGRNTINAEIIKANEEAVSVAIQRYVDDKSKDAKIENIVSNAAKTTAESKGANLDNIVKEAESELAKEGIFKNDRIEKRLLFQFINNLVESVNNAFKGVGETIKKFN